MNMVLAEWEASNGYAKPQDIETVMQFLAEHGYDAVNWTALSDEYIVSWDSKDNRMVLSRKSDGVIEYPEEYFEKGLKTNDSGGTERYIKYNQNVIFALDQSFSFSSSNGTSTKKVTLDSNANATAGQTVLSSALTGSNVNTNIKSALGLKSGNAYIAASAVSNSSTYSTGTYASCESLYVTDDDSLVITADLISTGKYSPNVYVVSVTYGSGATAEEKLAAEKAGGEYVYSLFVQMNSGMIDDSATIIIPAGTTINCSSHEWQAVKYLNNGYFGTPDASNPITIDGLRLTDATGYAQTYAMNGSASKYFMTGFIGVLAGNSTFENVTFRNVTIKSPGADFTVANDQNNRNTVGIVGGILPANDKRDAAIAVTIRNIVVENNCSIIGESSVGGLIGYVGAENGYSDMKGTINIEGCKIGCNVESLDSVYVTGGYGPVGGIIGFTCRCDTVTINVKNSEYTGTVKGYGYVGGFIGDLMNGPVTVNLDNVDLSKATITSAGPCTNSRLVSGVNYYGIDISKVGSVVGNVVGKINYNSACKFKDGMKKAGKGTESLVAAN